MVKAADTAHRGNLFLAAMDAADFERLLPRLEIVPLAHRAVLHDYGENFTHVYFLHTAIVSLIATMRESGTAEVALVGPEGLIGMPGLLGSKAALTRALVQVTGTASRIPLPPLREALQDSARLRQLLFRYIGSHLAETLQMVACNGLHGIEARFCRWLLTAQDRAGRDSFDLTQDTLADVLGVRRPSVTVVARALQASGIISYSRGTLTIADRKGLEAAACECYGIIRNARQVAEVEGNPQELPGTRLPVR